MSRRPRRVRQGVVLGLVVVAVTAAAIEWKLGASGARPNGISPAISAPRVARRETRPTLDPARFVGQAALAHQVARDIPETLDQLYCYCECDKHAGHKSLLSCYTDGHAAT